MRVLRHPLARRAVLAASQNRDAENAVRFKADSRGVELNYASVSDAISGLRMGGCLDLDWKAQIEEDVAKRGE